MSFAGRLLSLGLFVLGVPAACRSGFEEVEALVAGGAGRAALGSSGATAGGTTTNANGAEGGESTSGGAADGGNASASANQGGSASAGRMVNAGGDTDSGAGEGGVPNAAGTTPIGFDGGAGNDGGFGGDGGAADSAGSSGVGGTGSTGSGGSGATAGSAAAGGAGSSGTAGSGASSGGIGSGGVGSGGTAGSASGGGSGGSAGTGGIGGSAGTNGGSSGASGTASGGAAGGPSLPNCQSKPFNGKTYLLCSPQLTWSAARSSCTSIGMDLVRVNDSAENQWLRDSAQNLSPPSDGLWIGAKETLLEGAWDWTDGTLFWLGGLLGISQGGAYTNWQFGQPSGLLNDCGVLDLGAVTGTWYSELCTLQTKAYACESP